MPKTKFLTKLLIKSLVLLLIAQMAIPGIALASENKATSSRQAKIVEQSKSTEAKNAQSTTDKMTGEGNGLAEKEASSEEKTTEEITPEKIKDDLAVEQPEENSDSSDDTAPKEDPEPMPIIEPAWEAKQITLKADDVSGAAVYNLPLSLPPGRNGMNPSLVLNYNSQTKDNDNIFGYGWEMPISYIVRSTRKGTDKLYTENDFSLDLGVGEKELKAISLIDSTHGEYAVKIEESDTYFKIEFKTDNSWLVKDKQGTQYVFGASSSGRQDDPANPAKIYKWLLEKIIDTNGNFVSFEYFKNEGQVYPKKIAYTGYGSDPGIFAVEFRPFAYGSLSPRSDASVVNTSGFPVKTNYLVEEILIKANGSWARKYELKYTKGNNGNRSLLSQIIESGRNTAGETIALGPINFRYQNGEGVADLLSEIDNQQIGGKSQVKYLPSTQMKDASGKLLNPKLPFLIQTVQQITINDGFTTPKTTTYEYADGYYYTAEQFEQKFAGFGKVTRTDAEGNITKTYYHQGNGTDISLGERDDHIAKRSRPFRQEFYDNTGALEKVVVQRWYGTDLGNGRRFVNLELKIETDYTASKAATSKLVEYIYDSVGNVDQEINLGKVSIDSSWSYSDIESDKIKRDIDYASNDSKWIKALPEQEQIFNASSALEHKKTYYYDGQTKEGRAVPDKGNLTQLNSQLGAKSSQVSLKLEYDGTYGLVTKEKDPKDNPTDVFYADSYKLYPTSKKNAASQTTTYTHDLATGQVLTETDPNGNTITKVLDALGRVKEVWGPDTDGASARKQVYIYVDTPLNKSVSVKTYFNSTDYTETVEYYDGLGQLIQKRTRIKDDGADEYSVIDYTYDSKGQVIRQSIPYVRTGSARTSADASQPYTSFVYDSLGRKLTETYSSSTVTYTTTYAYDGWTTTITDPEGNQKKIYNDAFGNIVKVEEFNEGQGRITEYQYNALQKLIKIIDVHGNVREFEYDSLGRRTKAQDLHKTDDPTFGSWNYGYDAASNLIQVTDPKAQVINYTYDSLNRVKTEDFAGASGTEATYTYDTATQGIGRLASAQTPSFTASYQYNNQGQIKQETRVIKGETYATTYSYDWQGNPLQITYPDSFAVKYTYNPVGQLNKVEKKESGGSFTTLISNIDYSPIGQVKTKAYFNGVTETNEYNPNELYRLKHKQSVKASTNLQYINYNYDKVGNIMQIADSSATAAARTSNYAYDDLYRLTSASGTYAQSFVYDRIGNITNKHGLAFSYNDAYLTSYANPHAVIAVDGQAITYDQNGNVLSDHQGRSYAYDYQNRLVSLTKDGKTTNYLYDHQRQRIYKETPSLNQSTTYVNQMFEIEKDGYDKRTKRNVYAGNSLAAVSEKSEIVIADLDHDGYYSDTDCDDRDATEYPGLTWRKDKDNDNYYSLTSTCQRGDSETSYWYSSGHSLGLDCNDTDASIHPGAADPCDGLDQACDGIGTEVDSDSDSWLICEGDCDDSKSSVHPGQPETPYDGLDNDCNPLTLDDDLDQDGYEYALNCDDSDPASHPGVVWYFDQDNDNYYSAISPCKKGAGDPSKWYATGHSLGEDCDDTDPQEHPTVTWHLDADGDSYYAETSSCTRGAMTSDEGLAGYWPLNEESGLTAFDSSEHKNNGMITNAAYLGGISGSALEFDGLSGNVKIPDNEAIQNIFDGGGSVSVWINPDSLGEATNPRILDKTETTVTNGWTLFLDTLEVGKVKLRFLQ